MSRFSSRFRVLERGEKYMAAAPISFQQTSVNSNLARKIRYQGTRLQIHADSSDTRGHFALLEFAGGPGGEPPLHVHRYEDELFYVLEGELRVFRGCEEIILRSGESALLPRNIPHTFKIVSSHARGLVYITPGGFEGYFRELGTAVETFASQREAPRRTPAEMMQVAERYGVAFLL
jgi:quercetin dioxygenase-like cupin family protein